MSVYVCVCVGRVSLRTNRIATEKHHRELDKSRKVNTVNKTSAAIFVLFPPRCIGGEEVATTFERLSNGRIDLGFHK